MLADHLGSTTAVVDSDGSNPRASAYLSFGGHRTDSASSVTDRLFTGQRLEAGTGLYQVGGRWYDPMLGRFLQPDPMGQRKINDSAPYLPLTVSYSDAGLASSVGRWNRSQREIAAPLDPQLLNRYSYSRNNPLTYYDPSGNFVWVAAGAVAGGVVGFGGYALTHRDNFDWGEAALWTGAGALAGSGVGLAYELAAGGAVAAGATLAAGGTAGVAAAAQQLGKLGLNSPQATNLIRTITNASTKGVRSGTTVLGHYGKTGDYIKKAKEVGGTYFEMADDTVQALGDKSLRWTVNQQFLDDAVARGDRFLLTTARANPGSTFEKEIDYLLKQGYQYVTVNGVTYLQK